MCAARSKRSTANSIAERRAANLRRILALRESARARHSRWLELWTDGSLADGDGDQQGVCGAGAYIIAVVSWLARLPSVRHLGLCWQFAAEHRVRFALIPCVSKQM